MRPITKPIEFAFPDDCVMLMDAAGKPTAEYLGRVSKRITFFGAIFLTFIALVPTLIFTFVSGGDAGLINAFSATGLIIVVSTALEFNKQLEAQLLMRNYKGFLK